MLLIFAIPAALTYTYGRMAQDQRQGWALFAAMAVLFVVGVRDGATGPRRTPTRRCQPSPCHQAGGNMEGKEVRFGIADSALFATVTTDASCGAVNAMHDSFTPLGGLVPLVNIQLGEVIFGGVGAGLYGMLVFVVLTRLHRRPDGGPHAGVPGQEDRGAGDEAGHALRADLPARHPRLLGLGGGVSLWASPSLNNAGPHGLTEILYAFTSGAGNNGSAFAGLNANTPWWNVTLAARPCSPAAS